MAIETLKPGDRIVCKIKDASIVAPHQEYDEQFEFDIISVNYQGYYLYVPPWIFIKSTTPITEKNYKSIGVPSKFVGSESAFITSYFIVKVSNTLTGLFCQSCNEYFEWAEANLEGGKFICWNCRTYRNYY